MITESTAPGDITADETGTIFVATCNIISRDGAEIARISNRTSYFPGQDLTGADPKLVAIASAVWTPEIIAAYQSRVSAEQPA